MFIRRTFLTGNDQKLYTDEFGPPGTFRLNSLGAHFITQGATGARLLHVGVFDANDTQLLAMAPDRTQGGGQARWYYCWAGAPIDHTANDEQLLSWPLAYAIPPGGYIRVWDANNSNPANDVIDQLHVDLSTGAY